MSCQQAARLITATNASVPIRTREDPYVFTDTVSSTPPILFNIQKSRGKLPESANTNKFIHQKLPLTQLNGFAAKTQAALANVVSITTVPPATNFKYVSQSPQQKQNKKPTTTNVGIVRPKQQKQQQQLQQQHQTSLPTPSLWQTPLLLETIVSPPTSPASLPSPTPVAPTIPITSTTLPPSNFHHTTFAQHLQKVGCIRKSPPTHASKERNNLNSHDINKQVATKAVPTTSDVKSNISTSHLEQFQQHSDSDLQEIPVNVIYRQPQHCVDIAASPQLLAENVNNGINSKQHNYLEPSTTPTIAAASSLQATVKRQSNAFNRDLFSSEITTSTTTTTATSSIADKPTVSLAAIYKATKSEKCSSPAKSLQKKKAASTSNASKIHLQSQINKKKRRACSNPTETTAFAVVTCPAVGSGNTSFFGLSDNTELPEAYCLQHHWLGVYDLKSTSVGRGCLAVLSPNVDREERIVQHKNMLRRQAMQLLSMRQLLHQPMQVARRRLICVDRLLRKHEDHREVDFAAKSCIVAHCSNQVLPMTTHCYAHIGFNVDQQLFLTCTAKFADNSQCRIPVFDIVHDLPLCTEHARKRDAYNRSWHEQHPRKMSTTTATTTASANVAAYGDVSNHPQQHQLKMQPLRTSTTTYCYNNVATNSTKLTPQRNIKRKSCSSYSTGVIKPVGRPQKRSKKTTYSVIPTNAPAPPPLSAVKQRKSSNTSLESIASNSHSSHSQPPFVQSSATNVLAPPALAPLSGGGVRHYQAHQQQHHPKQQYTVGGLNRMLNFSDGSAAASHEINQIVAQFAMVANDNNNSNSHTDFSSVLSSLPSADEILTQDMLSICENSSVYASSEDTGVGGLSETELMVGAHDAEEIPLGDTRLLEEHDLANVLNTLPVDAFNELFTVVRQDERDEVERALEIADKHLKSLQQTIGSDSDFLGDFLNVNDHMLDDSDICSKMEIVSSVLHSPDTSEMDLATRFCSDGGISNNGGGSCTPAVTDIRGLVQT